LKPGDEVIKTSSFETEDGIYVYETDYVVSSVGKDTKVYFKGGNGRCAWPTQLKHKLGEQGSAHQATIEP